MRIVRKLTFVRATLWIMSLPTTVDTQRGGRRVVTLELLSSHPFFFHGEEVVLQADAIGENVLTYLVDDEFRLLALDIVAPPEGTAQRVEVIGTFFDPGRLEPGDPRAQNLPIERLSNSLLRKAWPTIGELPLIVASSARPFGKSTAITLRSVALAPQRYRDMSVTVTGRFGGRNLNGNLPDSPGESHHDFVLASADAAVWIVGKEPKGNGFELDVQARIDTGRWLEVIGSVRVHEGMAIIDAGTIRLAEPGEKADAPTLRVERRLHPPPDVVFSAPFEGDTDIPTDTRVRIQFSRAMDTDSFDGRIRIEYPQTSALSPEDRPDIEFVTEYQRRNRVLEISFLERLLPFTAFKIDLMEGITSRDGVGLVPWSLSFFSGR